MKTELLHQVLETEKGARRESKGVYSLSDEVELTLLLDLGHEVLAVPRVRRIASQADLLTIETHKGERYYVGPDTPIKGLKFSEVEGNKLRGAGFTKNP